VSGAKKILMVLINFTDATLQPGAATYWGNVVHSTTSQSVAQYYKDTSFNTVAVTPVTSTQPGSPNGVVVINLPQAHPNCSKNCLYSVESAWINSALAAAAPYVNFASLDTNLDNTISVDEALIYFVLAGYEASAGASTPSIWAHAWGGPGVSIAGKNINHWALNGERYNGSTLMTMGVVTHEMGHAMGGLPDLYDTSGSNGGLGIFSLMASGSWGAKTGEVGGTTPVGLDAWSRQYLGWSTPQEPVNGSLVSFSSPLLSPTASVMLINSAVSTSEYWLVENRPPVGWDAGMATTFGSWSGGLLIQHIDLNIGSKSANNFNRYVVGSHQGNMAVEPSTKTCSLVTPPGTWGGCVSLMYYAGNSTTFNVGSNPTSNYYSGAPSSVGVTNVSAPSGTMTANIQTPTVGSTFALTVSRTGSGRVTSADSTIDCGITCSANYVSGTSVVLTATASPGGSFTGWSGACTGTSTCSVSMTAARSVTATFASVPDFPAGGSVPSGWVQPVGSNAAWAATTGSTFSGTYGLRSGTLTDSQVSRVSYTGNFNAGNVSFARRVSSEDGYDFLTFYIDGVAKGTWSGEVPWGVVSYAITAGTHTVMWEYSKDEGVAGGSDTAWVDEVYLPLAGSTGSYAPWIDMMLLF
jgi:M6 family metalloprotease-like protein